MNLNQLIFHRINFCQIWALERREFQFSNPWENRKDKECTALQRQWKDDLRISRKTFESIVEIVQPRLQKENTQLRNAIPIEKKSCCSYLATGYG